jgi:hypothetical protein
MMRRLLLLALACWPAAVFAAAPPWVKELTRVTLPAYPADTAGVVLLDDINTTVTARGEIRTTHRIAYKILGTSGRDLGVIAVNSDSETKLTSLRGWTIAASGEEFQVKERDAVQTAAFAGGLYSDSKMTVLTAPARDPGSIVAFEYEQRDRPYSLQSVWTLHREVPVRTARYTLVLPEGWTYEDKWFNTAAVAPQVTGQTTRWEVNGLTAIKDEPRMPSSRSIGGRVGINFVPADERLAGKTHRSWDDVARTFNGLFASRGVATPELQAKTRELIAGKETALAKITALATFAQRDVRYVAIEIGIGGLQPHMAGDVFANRYGDCKDKVNVLSAMLREAGFQSYFVLANVYRGWVDPSFATLSAFNHAIIAIRLPAGVDTKNLPAVVDDGAGGKVLLFDPTSEKTPFGTLPTYLQQNHVLLVDGARGRPIDVRPHPADATRYNLVAKLNLDAAGTLAGEVSEVRSGAIAAEMREYLGGLDDAARRKYYEARLSRHLTGTTTLTGLTIEHADDASRDLLVRYTFSSLAYARRAGGMLLVRPRVLGTKVEGVLDLSERQYGYESDGPSMETDHFEITLPPGTTVSEMPPPAHVESSIFRYDSKASYADGKLTYQREYRVNGLSVAREALPELNKAFSAIVRDERSSAIVAQK